MTDSKGGMTTTEILQDMHLDPTDFINSEHEESYGILNSMLIRRIGEIITMLLHFTDNVPDDVRKLLVGKIARDYLLHDQIFVDNNLAWTLHHNHGPPKHMICRLGKYMGRRFYVVTIRHNNHNKPICKIDANTLDVYRPNGKKSIKHISYIYRRYNPRAEYADADLELLSKFGISSGTSTKSCK